MPRSTFCPSFTLDSNVDISSAMLDKVELEIGDWLAIGEASDISQMLWDISQSKIPTNCDQSIPLFKAKAIPELSQQFKLTFAGAGSGTGPVMRPAPLLAGYLRKARQTPAFTDVNHSTSFPIRLDLSVNPTRFIQAQQLKRRPRLGASWIKGKPTLAISPEQQWFKSEKCPIPATNLIVGENRRFRFALSETWQDHFLCYLDTVNGFFTELFRTHSIDNNVLIRRNNFVSLKSLEVYWEFDSESPLDLVETLSEGLISIGDRSSTRDYATVTPETTTIGQSRRVTIELRKDVFLRVYPKTTQRVRFEIEFKKYAISKAVGRRTSILTADLTNWLEVLVEIAANDINKTFAKLQEAQRAPVDLAPPHLLIHQICLACGDPSLSRALLASLVHNQRISLSIGDPMADAVKYLCRLKVLQRLEPRSRVYVAQTRYRAALARLSQATGLGV